MRKTKKLAAVMAVALGVGITPYANAVIELKHNGTGDAMLFPVFNGYVENYFTISNNHNAWVQGHLRFRGAAWTGELRDFDVILSPGDVFVFRVADLDGDGMWEIDQSLDPNNFAYTGQLVTNPNDGTRGCTTSSPTTPCMRPSEGLIPVPTVGGPELYDAIVTQAVLDHQRKVGYIEFIGEAVLDGMTSPIMNQLINSTGARDPSNCANVFNYQTKFFSGRGTNAWMWSDTDNVANGSPCDQGLSDVPNVLSGTAFIALPGRSAGIAYNAEVFTNFRTATSQPGDTVDVAGNSIVYATGYHRIDNYNRTRDTNAGPSNTPVIGQIENPVANPGSHIHPNATRPGFSQDAEDRAVIRHDESAGNAFGVSPFGDYVYGYPLGPNESRTEEAQISFNNTWGPTLADGDDYDLSASYNGGIYNVYGGLNDLRPWVALLGGDSWSDEWDWALQGNGSGSNSVAEVEEAIRVDGQNFVSYYFDDAPSVRSAIGGDSDLKSFFFAHFPTKFYYGESGGYYGGAPTREIYIKRAVSRLLSFPKPLQVEVWDIFENSGGRSTAGCISPDPCGVQSGFALSYELNYFSITELKGLFNLGGVSGYRNGRVVLSPGGTSNNPLAYAGTDIHFADVFPGLFYTFEINSRKDGMVDIEHWRSMQRGK